MRQDDKLIKELIIIRITILPATNSLSSLIQKTFEQHKMRLQACKLQLKNWVLMDI